jgi:hypothetical protein
VGVFTTDSVIAGPIAGSGALVSIWLSHSWLPLLSHSRTRLLMSS